MEKRQKMIQHSLEQKIQSRATLSMFRDDKSVLALHRFLFLYSFSMKSWKSTSRF